MEDLQRLYQTIILDHGKKPRNTGRIDPADREVVGNNRLCGDKFTLTMQMDGDVIKDARFDGEGCAISTASASLMTELIKEKTEAEAARLFTCFDALMTGKDVDLTGFDDEMQQLNALGAVKDFPNRVKCATLAWHALDGALSNQGGEITTE